VFQRGLPFKGITLRSMATVVRSKCTDSTPNFLGDACFVCVAIGVVRCGNRCFTILNKTRGKEKKLDKHKCVLVVVDEKLFRG
jgi:hypothetical protein